MAGARWEWGAALLLAALCGTASAAAYAPRYQCLASPPFLGDDAGEPSIAFNPASKLGLFQSGVHTLRYTLPEYRTDDPLNPGGLPESCDTLWEDVTPPNGPTVTLDPIGLGVPDVGRYFASQLAVKSAIVHYSDDDGRTWSPSGGNFPGAAGLDHQTLGWGAYVAGGLAGPLTDFPYAIYFCSQDSDQSQGSGAGAQANSSTAGQTNCSRSDDGGATYLPPVTVHTTLECGGLQGHVRAAPDGTVYLPNKNCITHQGVAVSTDNGMTWTVQRVPTSTPGATDPQIALASDGTGYFCYANGDGHPHVAVTHDRGQTWSNDSDLGAPVGVVTAVFTQGIAGDPGRAACGFIGTTTAGNSEAEDFTGIWFPYISVTYDGGLTWSTTNVSPGDPAQGAGGICTAGITCGSNRNLLDFNDMTLDDRGRPLMAFADGCIGPCALDPSSPNRSAKAAIARAVGGKSLYASLDRAEPHASQAACLSGARNSAFASLTWRPPADDGRAPVTEYRIYRSTSPAGAGTLIASVGSTTAFADYSADPSVPEYYYTITAQNAAGAGGHSNRVRLPLDGRGPTESVCIPPGLAILADTEGDAADGAAAHDVLKLSIAQPSAAGAYRIDFTLRMTGLSSLPPDTIWPVSFCSPAYPCTDPGAAYGASNKYFTVEMSSAPPASAAAPAFQVRQPTAGGATPDTRTVVPALPESAYTASGSIRIAVAAADLGLQPSGAGTDRLRAFRSAIAVGGLVGDATMDLIPDDGAGAGEFVTRPLDACDPATDPVVPPEIQAPEESKSGSARLFGPDGGAVPVSLLLLGVLGAGWRRTRRPRNPR